MAEKKMFNLKVDKDGFCWQVITTEEAKKRYSDNKEVYRLYDDDTEGLVEDESDFEDHDEEFGIELGFLSDDSIGSIQSYIATKNGWGN